MRNEYDEQLEHDKKLVRVMFIVSIIGILACLILPFLLD